MMSSQITKTAISLGLIVVHTQFIDPLKALIFLYLMILHKNITCINLRKCKIKTYFSIFIVLSKISHLLWHISILNFTCMSITFIWRELCLRFFI